MINIHRSMLLQTENMNKLLAKFHNCTSGEISVMLMFLYHHKLKTKKEFLNKHMGRFCYLPCSLIFAFHKCTNRKKIVYKSSRHLS